MEYEEFKNCVVESVKKELSSKEKIEIHSMMKNNSKKMDGLMVFREGSTIAPALYLNEYFEEYQKGEPIGSIVGEITDFYKYEKDKADTIDIEFFKDYDQIREHIFFKLINYDRNREQLAKIPHIRTLDLAIVFYCRLRHDTMGDIMIQIYNSHMQMWKAGLDDLYEVAMKNSQKKLPIELKSMNEVIRETLLQDAAEIEREDVHQVCVDDNMYVLTNYLRQYGAACMLYPTVLSKFAMTIGSDFYIIPSSVHEVILLPARKDYTKEKLEEMVRQVNKTHVAQEDVLSDSVYIFSKKIKKIIF